MNIDVAVLRGRRALNPRLERRRRLVDEIRDAGGFLNVSALVQLLHVSPMTIRRDLAILEHAGTVRRTRGGAIAAALGMNGTVSSLAPRTTSHPEAKRAIARRGAAEVTSGQVVGIDVGSTTLEICPYLAEISNLTVVTSSLPIATALATTADVYLPGGRLRPREFSLVGAAARDGIGRYHLDIVFVGAAGIDAEGLSDYSVEDSEIKRLMIANADRVVVLSDASKLGRRSAVRVCDLADVQALITDERPPAGIATALATGGVEVIIAALEPVRAPADQGLRPRHALDDLEYRRKKS